MRERLIDQLLARTNFDQVLRGVYGGNVKDFIHHYSSRLENSFAPFVLSKETLEDARDKWFSHFKGRSLKALRNIVGAFLDLNEEYLKMSSAWWHGSPTNYAYALFEFDRLVDFQESEAGLALLTRRLGLTKISEFVIPGRTGATRQEVRLAIRHTYGLPNPSTSKL